MRQSSVSFVAGRPEVHTMIQQLRIYEIFENNKAAFHARFRDHAARIMKTYGFQILAMWETKSDERTEFVYLLHWPDEKTKIAAWADFMQDKEWAEIKRITSAEHGLPGRQDRRPQSHPDRLFQFCAGARNLGRHSWPLR
jgi:heme-degrading monooxygenase HmoA